MAWSRPRGSFAAKHPSCEPARACSELPQSGDAARAEDAHLHCRDRAGAAVTPYGLPGHNQSGLDPQGLSRVRLLRGEEALGAALSAPLRLSVRKPNATIPTTL